MPADTIVADGQACELWRGPQNRYFREHGLDLTVDPAAAYATPRIGPIRQANEAAAREPAHVLGAPTGHNATLSEHDLALIPRRADAAEGHSAVQAQCRNTRSRRWLAPRGTASRDARVLDAASQTGQPTAWAWRIARWKARRSVKR